MFTGKLTRTQFTTSFLYFSVVTSRNLLSNSLSVRVWQVRYNVFHDQLVLTSGSDARVVLASVASLSSEPFGKLMSDDKDNEEGDLIILYIVTIRSYERFIHR